MQPSASSSTPVSTPRLVPVIRNQSAFRAVNLDGLLSEDHRARHLWEFVEHADLSGLAQTKSVEGRGGRPAFDPRVLLALWLYATSQGVGSARRLSELCTSHLAYMWLCGDETINAHTLSDFRRNGAKALETVMKSMLIALVASGNLELHRVSQDGIKVRSHVGASSFRRKETLEKIHAEVDQQIERLRKEIDENPAASSKREQSSRQRALRRRKRGVEEALKAVKEIQKDLDKKAAKAKPGKDGKPVKVREARASTTDADARVMHMADNGFRPAANIQFVTDTETRLVVGVDVSHAGVDYGQMNPMMDVVERTTGRLPKELLADGGYSSKDDIEAVAQRGVDVFAPIPNEAKKKDPFAAKRGDSPEVAAWRKRMGEPATAEIYKLRAATSETVHADMREHRGLHQFPVRGMEAMRSVALLMALTYNVLRVIANGWMAT